MSGTTPSLFPKADKAQAAAQSMVCTTTIAPVSSPSNHSDGTVLAAMSGIIHSTPEAPLHLKPQLALALVPGTSVGPPGNLNIQSRQTQSQQVQRQINLSKSEGHTIPSNAKESSFLFHGLLVPQHPTGGGICGRHNSMCQLSD